MDKLPVPHSAGDCSRITSVSQHQMGGTSTNAGVYSQLVSWLSYSVGYHILSREPDRIREMGITEHYGHHRNIT
jgi:hypothetical protein